MGKFSVIYNAGGVIDKIKQIVGIEKIETVGKVDKVSTVDKVTNVDNVSSVDVVDSVTRVDNVSNVSNVEDVDNVDTVNKVNAVETVQEVQEVDSVNTVKKVNTVTEVTEVDTINKVLDVDTVKEVSQVNKIKGFATKDKPYNIMNCFDVPALNKEFNFEMNLPEKDVEILAITLTCSGYGENDCYDLYFNNEKWFDNWCCSEVKEGLFLGSSTYVYSAQANSKIILTFKNNSGTSKKVWLGVRMLTS